MFYMYMYTIYMHIHVHMYYRDSVSLLEDGVGHVHFYNIVMYIRTCVNM